jgi:hypothetical protein
MYEYSVDRVWGAKSHVHGVNFHKYIAIHRTTMDTTPILDQMLVLVC